MYFQMEIMYVPNNLKTDENGNYILSIIDQFSKYGNNYILRNKNADIIVGKLTEFIKNLRF